MTQLYRVVYTSRNLMEGSEAELDAAIADVLATSQRNNARVGVTGALLFNKQAFAQVLEGPRAHVETTFERIQCDARHGDVTVLECAPAESRVFPNWSMAFVGRSAKGQALWGEMATRSGFDHKHLAADDVLAVLQQLVTEEEDAEGGGAGALPERATMPVATAPPPASQDFDAIRGELRQIMTSIAAARGTAERPPGHDSVPGPRAVGPSPSAIADASNDPGSSLAIEVGVLRQALASERARTSALRDEIDAAQAALLAARERSARLETERDLWAERVRSAARALFHDIDAFAGDEVIRAPGALSA